MLNDWRNIIEFLDVRRAREVWRGQFPHLPQPETSEEMLITLHVLRTEREGIPVARRYYSHRWLLDHGLTSHLPDKMKPRAERMYPRKVLAVGIALTGNSGPEACAMIQGAMEYAVNDCFANGDTDSAIVRPQMMRARLQERKALGLGVPMDVSAEWRP